MTTPTKERPILFTGAMIRAILAEGKTQTRRIAKAFDGFQDMDKLLARFPNQEGCPYGKPGDRLWVRETWSVSSAHDYLSPKDIPSSAKVEYAADGSSGYIFGKGRPLLFMPRWASRITLEITAIKVERLQDISGPDCWAEGIAHAGWDPERYGSVVECYRNLWQSIHGPGSWDANPWLWVIQFQRIQQP